MGVPHRGIVSSPLMSASLYKRQLQRSGQVALMFVVVAGLSRFWFGSTCAYYRLAPILYGLFHLQWPCRAQSNGITYCSCECARSSGFELMIVLRPKVSLKSCAESCALFPCFSPFFTFCQKQEKM